jgi:DNA-binding transcriptional ArsR family regulator
MKWIEKLSGEISGELLKEIRDMGTLTDQWCITMDFAMISPYTELNIPDALIELENLSLYRFNKVFKIYGRSIDKVEKNRMIQIMRAYYESVFQHEILYLQPFLIRVLKREMEACRKDGLLLRIKGYHDRLKLNDTEIIFHKNKEYHYTISELNKVVITASTFLSPHLMMLEENNILYLTMLVAVEEKKDIVPADLVRLLKALGDETRLKILHEIRRQPASTQGLAVKLKLTEAGISKHLKFLLQAGLVDKQRQGNYILYGLKKDSIDFLPYTLYEYIMS